jgi:protein SCO1/2
MLVLAFVAGILGRRPAPLPVLRGAGEFVVTNQAGATVTSASLRGRPHAVNLIFTRCPGPCRQLSGVMRRVAELLPAGSRSGLLSVTSDPEFDTPAVLSAYGAKFGAKAERWQFVTAGREAVRRLVTEQWMMVLVDKAPEDRDGPDDLFLHSTLIVVLDGRGRVRSAIEGLDVGAAERVVGALRQLEEEQSVEDTAGRN